MKDFVTFALQAGEKYLPEYEKAEAFLSAPEVIADNGLYKRTLFKKATLEKRYALTKKLSELISERENCLKYIGVSDPVLGALLQEEVNMLEPRIEATASELLDELSDANDGDAKVVVSCKTGEEKYAETLISGYKKYAAQKGYETLDDEQYPVRTLLFKNGLSDFSREEGYHRFCDKTAHTVCVEVSAPEKEFVPTINKKDIRIDLFHSSGAGGQNINKVESAVRLTHIPTGIVVTSQDERSQLMNREKAFKQLNIRLKEHYNALSEKEKAEAVQKKKDGLKVVRVYDLNKNVFTDERLKKTFPLSDFTSGKYEELVKMLKTK